MPQIENVSWMGTAKAKAVNISQIDSGVWLGKAEAAKLLKTSPRQLERRAQMGLIKKRYLPKRATETTARVVYLRDDIEKLLNGESELDLTEKALAWVSRDEAAAFLGVSKGQLHNRTRQGFIEKEKRESGVVYSMADLIALKAGRPIRVKGGRAAPAAQVALQTPGTALAKRGTMSEWEDFARLLATIVKARETPLALERYMSVAEAVEYSGLPAAYLIKAAKAGTIRAVNVGTGKREFWRFAREGAK